MSKIKLPHASGNSMSIGAPATNPASDLELKLPATIGTAGQYLTVDGSGNLTWADPPGITSADLWRQSEDKTSNQNPIDAWERVDTTTNSFSQGFIGSGMSESSGVFSFPSTGIWLVQFNACAHTADEENYFEAIIGMSGDNGSNWDNMAYGYGNHYNDSSNVYTSATTWTTVDVTNTSTQKVKFSIYWDSGANDVVMGSSTNSYTQVLFIRLGAT